MKNIGLTGDFFIVKYGVISRHRNKDNDHNLAEQDWKKLCEIIINPFAIGKYKNGFRLYMDMKVNKNWVITGVDIKSAGKNFEINAITTVFGIKKGKINDIIYVSENITPEQEAFLGRHNSSS
jgi:hypothetical protein